MQRHAQLSDAQKQLLPLLERDYREDVRAYMYEMQVRFIPHFRTRVPHHAKIGRASNSLS